MHPDYSPSRLVIQSALLHTRCGATLPSGAPAKTPYTCYTCAADYPAGSPQVPFKPGPTFTDWQYLAQETLPAKSKGAFVVCPWCACAMTGEWLKKHQNKYSSAVYNAQGAWSLTKDGERQAFLLDPPATPFVAYVAVTMGQHVLWRSPLTLDRDSLRIGFGREVLCIDRPRLLEAARRCEAVTIALRTANPKSKIKDVIRHPFLDLDRGLTSKVDGLGVLVPSWRQWLVANGFAADVAFLESLSKGEIWGLSVLVKQKIEESLTTPIP